MLHICDTDFFEHDGVWSSSPASREWTSEIVRRLTRANIPHEVRKAAWGRKGDRQVFIAAGVDVPVLASAQADEKRAQWERENAEHYRRLAETQARWQGVKIDVGW